MTGREPPTDESLPIVEPPAVADHAPNGTPWVAGVLLAAGTSSRFGDRNKLLATHEGEPIVRRTAETLVASRLEPIVVVVGHEADRVREALGELPVETVHNPDYASGQASSVRTAITTLQARGEVDAAVIALGDMPFVDRTTIDALIAAYHDGAGDALAAAHEGERGNPVLFDRRFFETLADVAGDTGGRDVLLNSDSAALVSVDDPGVHRDIDEPTDL
jgi:molybdenum cofactor cytidylyltransferase